MEAGSPYQELKSKGQTTRLAAILVTSITLVLCLLVGLGTYILLSSSNESAAILVSEPQSIIEEIIIVEDIKPSAAAQVIEEVAPEIIIEVDSAKALDASIYEEVQEAIKQEEEVESQFYNPREMPFLHTLVKFSNDIASQVLGQLAENDQFASLFGQQESSTEGHSRQRRSLSSIGSSALKYISYLNFGRFMFREVKDITEYAAEGRKLSGDTEAFFLDNGFWGGDEEKPQVVEKIDTDVASAEIIKKQTNPIRLTTAFDDGWTPMVNKVSLRFITEMLTTLLNLMREYLMKDNVMECLWFMFCKDMNHQALYSDPMGYLARVNSVGLKVLVDKEGREADTVNSVWQALTKWEPLQCETMFPKCDGSKALEIVNEVANASRK